MWRSIGLRVLWGGIMSMEVIGLDSGYLVFWIFKVVELFDSYSRVLSSILLILFFLVRCRSFLVILEVVSKEVGLE